MTTSNGSTRLLREPPVMSLVFNRNLTVEWADAPALACFGANIVGRPCQEGLCGGGEPCARCVVRDCFADGQTHTTESEARLSGDRRRILRRTARPAEFRPDGSLQYVKEIIEDVTPVRIFGKTMRAVKQQALLQNGQMFFNILVLRLCKTLRAHTVFIAAFDGAHERVHTIATASRSELAPGFDYLLSSAPCRRLLDAALLSHPSGAAGLYPQCGWLQESRISGYVGVQLKSSQEKPIGVLVALFQKDIRDAALIEALLVLFARPASGALERLLNQRMLDQYRHITATSNDLLALLDRNFVHQIVNRAYAAFYGLSSEQIVGRSMSSLVGPEFFDTTIRPVGEKCFQGQQGHLQIWHAANDQSRRCLDMALYPHFEKGANRIKGIVLCAKDITRSKKLEANLRQSAKMEAIGRLAGGIVHDFNNILGAVVGYTDLALSIVEGQPDVANFLREIRQAGLRATELVKQILAFSRQEHEIRKPVQPKTILKEVLSLLRATIPADIAIRMKLKSDAYMLADPIHLHQIVINLCTNAQHAMRASGGTFGVELEDLAVGPDHAHIYPGLPPGPYIRMVFADTGLGIPADIQAKIFDPFFTTKDKGEGTGMGLTMVDSIVKSYKGWIDLHSEVGHGTTIEILLPAGEIESQPRSADPALLPQGRGERILVVDDQPEIAQVTAAMLASLGYSVETHTDSRKALRQFKSNPKAFDLVVSDVTMPGVSGDALAQKVLELRPDLPVILMTGHSDRVDQGVIRKIGVKKRLFKPLSLHVLAAAVRDVLADRL
jgi:PAS domain S-box-containing protein